jgi:hypothetical protein
MRNPIQFVVFWDTRRDIEGEMKWKWEEVTVSAYINRNSMAWPKVIHTLFGRKKASEALQNTGYGQASAVV